MLRILVDFLFECGVVKKIDDSYTWNRTTNEIPVLSARETDAVLRHFQGQMTFFDRCFEYAGEFLRGKPHLFRFDSEYVRVWDEFLDNKGYQVARKMLAKMLLDGNSGRCNVLNMCAGTGSDIRTIQVLMPHAKITAIDFTDAFYKSAAGRVPDPENVLWTDSDLWNGFGSPLPYNAETFDMVFFACADPYISNEIRDFVYSDIFRVMKPGGSLGILTHSYPDKEWAGVTDKWVRLAVLCHDFAESVCAGWSGFALPGEFMKLFEKLGFRLSLVMLNSSLWRLDKP